MIPRRPDLAVARSRSQPDPGWLLRQWERSPATIRVLPVVALAGTAALSASRTGRRHSLRAIAPLRAAAARGAAWFSAGALRHGLRLVCAGSVQECSVQTAAVSMRAAVWSWPLPDSLDRFGLQIRAMSCFVGQDAK